ncbi:hypothetical protein WJX77_000833 [Trebouxia sp. C0004]
MHSALYMCGDAMQEVDKLVLLTTSGNLSIIQFDATLYRFVSLSQIPLVPAGRQGLLPAQALHVEPCGHAIAIAGYNWVALMPIAVATQTPLEDSTILAVLPSFLSSIIHNPRQKAPAPPTPFGPDSPVDLPITASSDVSFSRSYTSDEAWLRAQTDSCRLDAMWMASDLNSIQDLVQDQEEHLSPASPLTSMPPSGLIRSTCFVEIPGKQNSLALAVLYYVAPDSGSTLDILQWTHDKTLGVKYRLQLHELADMFDFLLGSLVLDICTVRNCQSGLVLLLETGLVLLDLADIVDGGPNTPTGRVVHQNRVRCHSFAKGSSQSSIASVGVVYGAKWPAGPQTPSHVAPDPADISTPATTADEQPAGRSDPFGVQNSTRLLTSGCWRERLSPAFSAYPPSTEPAELHQELLLGFDVCEGFEHSVLSLVVKKQLARERKGSGWFADLQDTNFRPGSTPTSMLSLSNNHVLLGCETGDGCIARLPTPSPGGSAGSPLALGPSVTSTLHNAAPIWAFTVANLQRLPQDQVYAACGDSSNGSIRVIQADQTVEVLYESPADYPGISGMWSIPPWPGADFHCLLVLSFASGSRAMATGSTLRDVTDGVGLVANERTLACACLADRLLLQVMHKRMQLFTMDAALAPDQGELSCSPSGDRSRARLGEHLTLEDLEISTPDDHMPGDQQQGEEEQTGRGHATRDPIPTRSSSHPITPTEREVCGAASSQVWRCGEDVWMPPGGASISTAAAADATVVASCTHFKGLVAVQAVLADEGCGGRPWVAGAVAQSPGKRKRSRRRWCLQETARVALEDEVSCIHLLPYPQGGRGCKLVAAGTYKPGLQLLLLQTGERNPGTSQQPCFLPFASVAITPLMHQTFHGGAAAAPEEPPGSPRKALPDQAIPESAQILPLQSRDDDVQVLLGLRNGTMLQVTAQQTHSPQEPPLADPFQHPNPAVSHPAGSCGTGLGAPQLQLAAMKHLGSLPVVLIPLPTAVGLKGSSLALSDRMALLSCAPGTGRAVASPLAVAGVTHAVPLWQPATSASGALHSRFTVLCASSSGRLQLLDLQHQEHPNMRSLPLLPPARPVHLTVHPSKAVLVVASQGSDKLWELRCMHPVTGATLARYPLQAGECVSGICMWQRPPRPAAQKPSARATPLFTAPSEANEEGESCSTTEAAMPNPMVKAEGQEEEGAATSMAEARPKEEQGMEAGMAGSKAAEEEDAESSAEADKEEDEVFVVVGTGEGLKASSWSPCKGRLLLIQLAKSGSTHKGLWLHTLAELKFAEQVHAVAVLPSCAPKSDQAAEGVIVAAVGRRLVAFGEQHGQLQKHHLTATAQPVTCLSPDGDTGRFVASNEMDSVMAYDFKADSGFRMIHADRHSQPISHCAAVQNPTPSQATIAAVDQKGRALFMAPEPETYGPERNMYTAVQYHLGQAPAGIAEGNLRQRPRDDDNNAEPSQTASPSFSIHQDSFSLSWSALPEFGGDALRGGGGAEESGMGFMVGPAVHPPQTFGRPQVMPSGQGAIGHRSLKADKGRATKSSSWVTVTTAGDAMQLTSISEEQHKLLADLQHVMVKDAATAPLSGCSLEQYRAARDSPGCGRLHPAKGPHIALDGDLLAQFLYLPVPLQQRLVSAVLAHQAVKQASEGTHAGQEPLVSLPVLIWALEGTLPIC